MKCRSLGNLDLPPVSTVQKSDRMGSSARPLHVTSSRRGQPVGIAQVLSALPRLLVEHGIPAQPPGLHGLPDYVIGEEVLDPRQISAAGQVLGHAFRVGSSGVLRRLMEHVNPLDRPLGIEPHVPEFFATVPDFVVL